MICVQDVCNALNQLAPFSYAESYDNVGLLIGYKNKSIKKVLVCLDITIETVEEAKKINAELIISHHPVIFHPLKKITADETPVVYSLIQNNISAIAAHTNLDIANGGVNDTLFELLQLKNKQSLSLIPNTGLTLGLIGELENVLSPEEFAKYVKNCLKANCIKYTEGHNQIKTVAIASGSCASLLNTALSSNVDAFVTGDIKHDVFIEAQNRNFTLVDAGHFATENPIIFTLTKLLSDKFHDIEFVTLKNSTEKVKYI